MNSQRPLKDLLFIVIIHGERFFKSGLCHILSELRYNEIINRDEYATLDAFIRQNKPKWYQIPLSSLFGNRGDNNCFYWKIGDWEVREKWLYKHYHKELLNTLAAPENIKDHFSAGFCSYIHRLYTKKIITCDQAMWLADYVHTNRPRKGKHFDKRHKQSAYFWIPGSWVPRNAWLQDQILKFS